MAELTIPQLDFSSLGQLPQIYKQAQRERTLADLGKGLASGTIDYKQAGATLASLGDINGGLSLMRLGEETKAGEEFAGTIGQMYQRPGAAPPAAVPNAPAPVTWPQTPQGGAPQSNAPRGIRNNNPLNLEASPFTQRQPGFTGSDGRFGQFDKPEAGMAAADRLLAGYGEKGINTISGVIGRWAPQSDGNPVSAYANHVAKRAGIDPNAPINLADPAVRAKILPAMAEFENGQPIKMASLGGGAPAPDSAPATPAGVQVAQAPQDAPTAQPTPAQALPAALMQDPSTAEIGKLLAASVNPRLPASQKEVAKTLLAHALKASELTSDQKEYLGAVAQGEKASFTDWLRGNKKSAAPTTNVYTGDNTKKFDEKLDTEDAERWIKIRNAGDVARGKQVDVDTMREISQRAGSQGKLITAKEIFGPYLQAVGVTIDDLSDIQTYSSVIERLTPQQRVAGSGSTSDIEYKGMRKAMPALLSNEASRETVLNTTEALIRDEMARGDIASRLITKEITRVQAEKELRALPDPMTGFRAWRKANPELYGQALKQGASAPTQAQPQRGNMPSPQDIEAEIKRRGL